MEPVPEYLEEIQEEEEEEEEEHWPSRVIIFRFLSWAQPNSPRDVVRCEGLQDPKAANYPHGGFWVTAQGVGDTI